MRFVIVVIKYIISFGSCLFLFSCNDETTTGPQERKKFTVESDYYISRGEDISKVDEIRSFLISQDTSYLVIIPASACLSCGQKQLVNLSKILKRTRREYRLIVISDEYEFQSDSLFDSKVYPPIIHYFNLEKAKSLGINFTTALIYKFAGTHPFQFILSNNEAELNLLD